MNRTPSGHGFADNGGPPIEDEIQLSKHISRYIILHNKDLDRVDRLILFGFLQHVDGNTFGNAFPSLSTISDWCLETNRQRVRARLGDLERRGYLTIKRGKGGRGNTNMHTVNRWKLEEVRASIIAEHPRFATLFSMQNRSEAAKRGTDTSPFTPERGPSQTPHSAERGPSQTPHSPERGPLGVPHCVNGGQIADRKGASESSKGGQVEPERGPPAAPESLLNQLESQNPPNPPKGGPGQRGPAPAIRTHKTEAQREMAAALTMPGYIDNDYQMNQDGTALVLNGARAEWLEFFDNDETDLDLALKGIVIEENSRRPIKVQIQTQLSRIAARRRDQDKRYKRAVDGGQKGKATTRSEQKRNYANERLQAMRERAAR